jgi:hypothetical protein
LLRSQGKFVCGCADSGVSRHLTRDRSGAGVKPLAPWTWWRCDLPGRWLGMLEIVCPNPQLEIRLGRDRRAVASEAASLATLRLTGETLKPFAAIQRASAGSRSAVHCRTESIRWIAPGFLCCPLKWRASLAWLLGRCMQPARPACASMAPVNKSHPSPRFGLGHKPGLRFRLSPRSESREDHAGKLANVFRIALSVTRNWL